MRILGVSIDELSREDILKQVEHFLDEPKFHRIATVNPEFLLLAEKDQIFQRSLTDADLRITDGFGIVLAGLLHGRCIARFPGADLMDAILEIANEKRLAVYLAVRKDGLSHYEEIKETLLKRYPNLMIDGKDIDSKEIRNWKLEIGNSAVILCNLGSPAQELFLENLRSVSVGARLGMGVGGSFDYLTGRLRRAPRWVRALGLEWLWRLILQPQRWKRIWNAVVVFPFRVLFATIGK